MRNRLQLVEDRIRDRLKDLSARLGDSDWLEAVNAVPVDLLMIESLQSPAQLDHP